jgi:hypothetical protein
VAVPTEQLPWKMGISWVENETVVDEVPAPHGDELVPDEAPEAEPAAAPDSEPVAELLPEPLPLEDVAQTHVP